MDILANERKWVPKDEAFFCEGGQCVVVQIGTSHVLVENVAKVAEPGTADDGGTCLELKHSGHDALDAALGQYYKQCEGELYTTTFTPQDRKRMAAAVRTFIEKSIEAGAGASALTTAHILLMENAAACAPCRSLLRSVCKAYIDALLLRTEERL